MGTYYSTVLFPTSILTVEISVTDVTNLYPYSKRLNILCQVGRIEVVRVVTFEKFRNEVVISIILFIILPFLQIQAADIVAHNVDLFHFNSHLIQEVINFPLINSEP
jgi:hypothetical protein